MTRLSASFFALSTTAAGTAAHQAFVQFLEIRPRRGLPTQAAPSGLHLGDVLDDPVVLGCSGDVDPVGLVLADVWLVRWYR